MTLKAFRITIRPHGPWRTPWRADVLAGSLVSAVIRVAGADEVVQNIIRPAFEGRHAFAVSDATPKGCVPAPMSLQNLEWPFEYLKPIKRIRFVQRKVIDDLRNGRYPTIETLLKSQPVMSRRHVLVRNSINREFHTTGYEDGGGLYNEEVEWPEAPHLDIAVRCEDQAFDWLKSAFELLAHAGFGGGRSVGRGAFDIVEPLARDEWYDKRHPDGAWMALGCFQPASRDPTDGLWRAFRKDGWFSQELGAPQAEKEPMMLLEAGACFKGMNDDGCLGRAIDCTRELADMASRKWFQEQGLAVAHFALAPAIWIGKPSW
ncbi:MAG: hypothetical protein GMKNLPBB_01018 [Myxococcota bacterium]|nr:hypothetical protein [Myxococcota bacterium]